MTDTINTYAVNDSSFFDLNFDSSNLSPAYWNILIEFDHKMESDTLLDGGFITVSVDSGEVWHNVGHLKATGALDTNYTYLFDLLSENLYGENGTLNSGTPAYSGTFGW